MRTLGIELLNVLPMSPEQCCTYVSGRSQLPATFVVVHLRASSFSGKGVDVHVHRYSLRSRFRDLFTPILD
jgi:hypothetical protein